MWWGEYRPYVSVAQRQANARREVQKLAKAGKKVTVLERNAWFGGGCVTRELTVPGFRHAYSPVSSV